MFMHEFAAHKKYGSIVLGDWGISLPDELAPEVVIKIKAPEF
jgi:hypothetical protein